MFFEGRYIGAEYTNKQQFHFLRRREVGRRPSYCTNARRWLHRVGDHAIIKQGGQKRQKKFG